MDFNSISMNSGSIPRAGGEKRPACNFELKLNMSKGESCHLLGSKEDGFFIVRASKEPPGYYEVDIKGKKGEVETYLLMRGALDGLIQESHVPSDQLLDTIRTGTDRHLKTVLPTYDDLEQAMMSVEATAAKHKPKVHIELCSAGKQTFFLMADEGRFSGKNLTQLDLRQKQTLLRDLLTGKEQPIRDGTYWPDEVSKSDVLDKFDKRIEVPPFKTEQFHRLPKGVKASKIQQLLSDKEVVLLYDLRQGYLAVGKDGVVARAANPLEMGPEDIAHRGVLTLDVLGELVFAELQTLAKTDDVYSKCSCFEYDVTDHYKRLIIPGSGQTHKPFFSHDLKEPTLLWTNSDSLFTEKIVCKV